MPSAGEEEYGNGSIVHSGGNVKSNAGCVGHLQVDHGSKDCTQESSYVVSRLPGDGS
jgi:hypothetical protein